ncbi:hypothetical protein D9758_002993 [Tetrapyrgos nigripes]|uniref:Uncharacterized protein n=1 Tax=Tetrapyrgos nigripes TaxID=182062 RepID=A0A8H5GPZ2_9AGAR|nr:hypothetical protein D9758_002993 [Tetrapyrgos nigripes]
MDTMTLHCLDLNTMEWNASVHNIRSSEGTALGCCRWTSLHFYRHPESGTKFLLIIGGEIHFIPPPGQGRARFLEDTNPSLTVLVINISKKTWSRLPV